MLYSNKYLQLKVIFSSTNERKSTDGGKTAIYLLLLIPVLNSLFNPLIYAVRIRHFRVAFIQLLSRKRTAEAEEVERKLFGPRQIGVTAYVEQGEVSVRTSASREEQQGNETLDNVPDTKVQT